jgi:arginyl-tRNA synthetase
MMSAREELLDALRAAMAEVDPGHTLAAAFETPKQADHGDLAVTAAMPLAKAQRRNPREVAAELIAALRAKTAVERWVESIAVAGPGIHQPAPARGSAPAHRRRGPRRRRRVRSARRRGRAVIVEFVSANPTGPLHVGHARQAALGDAICNLLETQGRRVVREFYYNDAGVQIATLAAVGEGAARRLEAGRPRLARVCVQRATMSPTSPQTSLPARPFAPTTASSPASGRSDDLDGIRQFAVAYLRHEQDLDLQAFGVRFDNYYLESSLYASGRVEATVARLVAAGKTYEDGGALWLRTTDYGDDKDRVMRKSDGTYTYFVPDVAYHLAKFERGFTTAINIQGTDHHGTIARVRAGLQAANPDVPARYPEYVLNTMVRVERGGEEVKISKRAGNYVTLRDLIDWTSRDAVRFFMLSRKADTEFTFDVDLALKQNDENPVFYVQYAHARICSVLEQYAAQGGDTAGLASADLARLEAPSETALLRKLAEYVPMLAGAAATLAPHEVAFYLRELAATFHSYYGAERFLVDDGELARARIALLAATRQIIRNALAVLGVSAPERMKRETDTA